jgi:hypothetical protein
LPARRDIQRADIHAALIHHDCLRVQNMGSRSDWRCINAPHIEAVRPHLVEFDAGCE